MFNEDNLIYKNLGELTNEDIPKVISFIKAISEALKRDLSRRYKKTTKKLRLDLRKTIRSNFNTGGILFHLKFKKSSSKKVNYIILCDVSASMYTFSGFVLQFLLGMHDKNANITGYIFSEEIEHFNIRSGIDITAFEHQIKKSNLWMKGTNINKSFSHLLELSNSILTSSTIVLVVSDAKTMEWEEAVGKLKVIKSKLKQIFWLNPLPTKMWNSIAGFEELIKHCNMLDCSTLERLSNSFSKI